MQHYIILFAITLLSAIQLHAFDLSQRESKDMKQQLCRDTEYRCTSFCGFSGNETVKVNTCNSDSLEWQCACKNLANGQISMPDVHFFPIEVLQCFGEQQACVDDCLKGAETERNSCVDNCKNGKFCGQPEAKQNKIFSTVAANDTIGINGTSKKTGSKPGSAGSQSSNALSVMEKSLSFASFAVILMVSVFTVHMF